MIYLKRIFRKNKSRTISIGKDSNFFQIALYTNQLFDCTLTVFKSHYKNKISFSWWYEAAAPLSGKPLSGKPLSTAILWSGLTGSDGAIGSESGLTESDEAIWDVSEITESDGAFEGASEITESIGAVGSLSPTTHPFSVQLLNSCWLKICYTELTRTGIVFQYLTVKHVWASIII